MNQTAKLKAALKAEIRKTIKESQELKEDITPKQGNYYDVIGWIAPEPNSKVDPDYLKPAKGTKDGDEGWYWILDLKYIGKDKEGNFIFKAGGPDNFETTVEPKDIDQIRNSKGSVNELARVASVIKIGNKKAAEAYVLANKGKWVSDMVQAVLDAGEAGITQPALATAIGKGSQQTINPKVREFITAGVFTQGEASVKTAQPKQEPKIKDKPAKVTSKPEEDDDDVEFTDDFEKSDAEDDAPEDEDTLAAKATPNKGVQSDAKKLDAVIKQMKDLAAEFKAKKGTPDGDAIVAKLKDLNKEKTKLEKIVHKSLGGDEDDDLLDTTND